MINIFMIYMVKFMRMFKECLIYFYWEQNSSLIRYKHKRKDTLFFKYTNIACSQCRGCSNHCEPDSNEILKINQKNIENTNVFTSFIYTIWSQARPLTTNVCSRQFDDLVANKLYILRYIWHISSQEIFEEIKSFGHTI